MYTKHFTYCILTNDDLHTIIDVETPATEGDWMEYNEDSDNINPTEDVVFKSIQEQLSRGYCYYLVY